MISALLPRMSGHATDRQYLLVREDFSRGVRLASVIIIGGGGAVLLYALCARMLRIDEFRVLIRTMTRCFA